MDVIAATLGASLFLWLIAAVIVSLAAPAFWLWMLIDAIVRDPADFASRDSAEKIVWVVVMLVLQPLAAAYFLFVWWPNRRRAVPAPSGVVAAA